MSQAQVLEAKTPETEVFHPVFITDPSGFYGGWHCFAGDYEKVERYVLPKYKRLVLLNALVPAYGILMCGGTVTPDIAKRVAQYFRNNNKPILSYIGHPATAQLLSRLLGVNVPVNRTMYTPWEGDVAIVARLNKRLEKPGDIKDIKPGDIVLWLYFYIE